MPHLGQLETTRHGSLDVSSRGWRAFEGVQHGSGNVSVTLADSMQAICPTAPEGGTS